MIQANELRVGNLLNYQTAEGDVVTLTTDFHAIQWATEDTKGFNLVHMPIPLTEKWLIKFGYVKSKCDTYWWNVNNIALYFNWSNKLSNYYGYELKYVHQLQNLYFAITGDELTIN